jgi:hypothetical protein
MLLGIDVITPLTGDWHGFQLPLIQRGKFAVGKVQISDGFATAPENVEQLLAVLTPGPNGRKTIILRSDDRAYGAAALQHDLVERGFDDLIGRRDDVDWYLEVSNEPDRAGIDINHHAELLADAIQLKPHVGHGRLSWLASMPTDFAAAWPVIKTGATDDYDGLACHWYSWTNPLTDSGGGDWKQILDHLLTLDRGIWITECGIDDKATPQAVKAQRILDWLATLPPRVVGACVFAVGEHTAWPQYELTDAAADVYAARLAEMKGNSMGSEQAITYPRGGKQRHYDVAGYGSPVVSGPFLEYFDANGGIRQFGYPLDDVVIEEGRPVQYFERNVMEYHPEADSAAWRVQLRRLGAEAYDAKYKHAG